MKFGEYQHSILTPGASDLAVKCVGNLILYSNIIVNSNWTALRKFFLADIVEDWHLWLWTCKMFDKIFCSWRSPCPSVRAKLISASGTRNALFWSRHSFCKWKLGTWKNLSKCCSSQWFWGRTQLYWHHCRAHHSECGRWNGCSQYSTEYRGPKRASHREPVI